LLTTDLAVTETRKIIESLFLSEDIETQKPIGSVPTKDVPEVASRIAEAEDMLSDYNPTARRNVDDLVGEIIVLNKDGYVSGSSSHILGVIWISVNRGWHVSDWAEVLLHESVHQSMFLTEMVRGIFRYTHEELASKEMLTMSSILKVPRPYDIAFHAATVSATLVDFHEWAGHMDRARQLCDPLIVTLTELNDKRKSLTAAGELILDGMMDLTSRTASFQSLKEPVTA